MSDDQNPNDEVRFGVGLTETGVGVSIRSRFVAARDTLLGKRVAVEALPVDAALRSASREEYSKDRALTRREAIKDGLVPQVIEAISSHLNQTPESIGLTLAALVSDKQSEDENLLQVLQIAEHDLRQKTRVLEDETVEGTKRTEERLDDDFIHRFKSYAKGATSEELRTRWGRVLAAEIRDPGLFNMKVLRTIDELDSVVAHEFERFCANRFLNVVPTSISELTRDALVRLEESGLLRLPMVVDTIPLRSAAGWPGYLFFRSSRVAVGFEESSLPKVPEGLYVPVFPEPADPIFVSSGTDPSVPFYWMTETGARISLILPHNEIEACSNFIAKAAETGIVGRLFELDGNKQVTRLLDA